MSWFKPKANLLAHCCAGDASIHFYWTALGMGIGWMASVAGEMISGNMASGTAFGILYTDPIPPHCGGNDRHWVPRFGFISSHSLCNKAGGSVRKAMTESLDQSITKR